jgi:hypothetical protein
MEIEKAVETADVVLVCLSDRSATKEGYVQRELKFVLDIALEKPEGTIFVIPLRLEECELPRRLRNWQYVDYFLSHQKEKAYHKILTSLKLRTNALEIRNDERKATPGGNNGAGGEKLRSNISLIQVFKIRSGDFFIKSLPMRQKAANEIRSLAKKIDLDDILQFANSSIPGERVASAIALGAKIKNDPACATSGDIRNALQILLFDRESRVRFRALESISYNKSLIGHFRMLIKELFDDENKSVKDLAASLLRKQ